MDDVERKKLCSDMGKRLYNARRAAGLTQDQAAEIGDTYQQTISEAEHGQLFHPPDVMYRLCVAYGISCDYLISGKISKEDFKLIDERLNKLDQHQYEHFKGIINHFMDALKITGNT